MNDLVVITNYYNKLLEKTAQGVRLLSCSEQTLVFVWLGVS